ncbi:SRPBCC family protein [soil metagenome]
MADQATERTTIDAAPDACWAVVLDFERYPDWARDIKQVDVIERDAEGRGLEVRFRAAAMGRSTNYTLRYDYTDAPHRLAWVLIAGDVTRKLDGHYHFAAAESPAAESPAGTLVTYRLEAYLVVPLPGFVKRRAESMIVHTALRELKARFEAEASDAGEGRAR